MTDSQRTTIKGRGHMSGHRRKRTWPQTLLLVLLLAGIASMLSMRTAQAAPNVTLRVTIERVHALDCFDETTFFCGSDADFYPVVFINGEEFSTGDIGDEDDISPNWEFSKQFDLASTTIVPVQLNIWDSDGFLRGDDDQADLDRRGGDRSVDLTVDLNTCVVSGDVNGDCDVQLTSAGTDDDNAQIWFHFQVEDPPSAPGLRVACTHSPIWPKPTDTVTFSAQPLDGALATKRVDSVELFINDKVTPISSPGRSRGITGSAGPFRDGTTIFYGCRVRQGTDVIWSGWHTVQIGTPTAGQAAPVLLTGPSSSRVDIVFIADKDSYTGPTDPTFISDVQTMVYNAYWREDIYLSNQDKVNFWIALDKGDAQNDCDSEAPGNWDDDYTFADTGAITHRDGSIRDCAPGGERFFSGDATRIDFGQRGRVFLHETGHRPFGLADEYCCDGGYYQNGPFPNLYEEPDGCRGDIGPLQPFDIRLGLPPRTASACREFEEDGFWFFDTDWSVSDPASNDLMNDNGRPEGADIRRMEWMFGQCASARC